MVLIFFFFLSEEVEGRLKWFYPDIHCLFCDIIGANKQCSAVLQRRSKENVVDTFPNVVYPLKGFPREGGYEVPTHEKTKTKSPIFLSQNDWSLVNQAGANKFVKHDQFIKLAQMILETNIVFIYSSK